MKKLGDYIQKSEAEAEAERLRALVRDDTRITTTRRYDNRMVVHFLIGAGVIAVPVLLGCFFALPSFIVPSLCILWLGSGIWLSI